MSLYIIEKVPILGNSVDFSFVAPGFESGFAPRLSFVLFFAAVFAFWEFPSVTIFLIFDPKTNSKIRIRDSQTTITEFVRKKFRSGFLGRPSPCEVAGAG